MVQFTRNVEKIKGAAHKNGDVDGTCKGLFTRTVNVTVIVSGTLNLKTLCVNSTITIP